MSDGPDAAARVFEALAASAKELQKELQPVIAAYQAFKAIHGQPAAFAADARRRPDGGPDMTSPTDTPAILESLVEWRRSKYRPFWADLHAEHGALIAIKVRPCGRWWELDDVVRQACDAQQDVPPWQRGLYLSLFPSWTVICRDRLNRVVDNLRAADGLRYLQVREVPA